MNKEQKEPIYAQVNKNPQKGGGHEPIYAELKNLGGTPYQNTKKNGAPIHNPSDETVYSEVRGNQTHKTREEMGLTSEPTHMSREDLGLPPLGQGRGNQTHRTREEMGLASEPTHMSLEDMGLTRRQQPHHEHGDRTHKTREEMGLTGGHKHEHGDRGKQTHMSREEMGLTGGHKHEHGDRGKQTHMSREQMGLGTPPPTPPKPSKGFTDELRSAVSKQGHNSLSRRNAMSGGQRNKLSKGPKM